MSASLAVRESARLAELESVVERGLATFVEVGHALMEIRDARLYRESHETFETYCRERWSFSRSHADNTINAAKAAGLLPTTVGIPNQRQARELAPLLDEPEKLREAWDEASSNGAPTAAKVRDAVQRVLPPVSEEARERQRRWAATLNVLDGLAHFDRPAIRKQAEAEAALIDQEAAATRGEVITPERLRTASAWTALLADALEGRGT